MTRFRALSLATLLAAAVTASASGPQFWTVASAADFLGGRSEGVFVNLDGVVSAGPALSARLTSGPAQVWSLAGAADGTLWAGTGGDGRLLRLREGQPEETVLDPDESHVFAVAVAGSRVYAAGSPDGRVYAIEPDGSSRTVFDPEEKYIWALAVDDESRLWVGTGSPAAIYRVDADGASQLVHRPPADHVVALVPDPAGGMLAGTESPGRLYRYEAGDPFVLLDSGLTELRAIAPGRDGRIFAAAVARGDAAPGEGETTSVAVTTAASSSSASSTGASSSSSSSSGASASTRRSVVFRVDADGGWESIWETADIVYDLAADADDGVLVATGPAGRLYRLTADRQVLLHTGVDARQVTRFARADDAGAGLAFATANPGRVFSIGEGFESPATYVSPVRDTRSVSTWGLMRWESTGAVRLFTRSGNTTEPDDSWSDWAGPFDERAGVTVPSPSARFVQWKAELTHTDAAPAALTSVTVAYLPRNTRPAVSEITVSPPGVVFQRPFSSEDGAIAGLDDAVAEARRPAGDAGRPDTSLGRRMFQKGLQTITWKATDTDSDLLTYTLEYRRDGEDAWQELRSGLLASIFVWDTTTMADGRYLVRVVASDGASNAADRALTGDRTSDPIVIDNTPPTISLETSGEATVVAQVRDLQSPIQKVEYSLRGGPWQIVYPADGLADSLDERYEIVLPDPADRRELVVRATDLLQNVASSAAGRETAGS